MPLPIFVSRNGQLVRPSEAHVSIFNPAFYGSYGVYESMQVVRGVPFALSPHLERLAHSAALIGLALPCDLPCIETWSLEALRANDAGDCVLRLFVLGPENGGEAVAYIWPQPSPVYPPSFYTSGATAVTYEGQRSLPRAKTLNTLVNYLAQRKAQAAGAHEGLLYHHGQLTEGATSNLFAVLGGVILTPPDEEVLSGVARDGVLQLAAENGLPVQKAPLGLAELARWSECFITSTSRHVMPITLIDGVRVGTGVVGPVTQRVMGLFEEHFRTNLTEYPA